VNPTIFVADVAVVFTPVQAMSLVGVMTLVVMVAPVQIVPFVTVVSLVQAMSTVVTMPTMVTVPEVNSHAEPAVPVIMSVVAVMMTVVADEKQRDVGPPEIPVGGIGHPFAVSVRLVPSGNLLVDIGSVGKGEQFVVPLLDEIVPAILSLRRPYRYVRVDVGHFSFTEIDSSTFVLHRDCPFPYSDVSATIGIFVYPERSLSKEHRASHRSEVELYSPHPVIQGADVHASRYVPENGGVAVQVEEGYFGVLPQTKKLSGIDFDFDKPAAARRHPVLIRQDHVLMCPDPFRIRCGLDEHFSIQGPDAHNFRCIDFAKFF
jgi:hypothetical protein